MVARRLLIGLIVALNLFLVYRLVMSEQGVFAYLELKSRFQELENKIEALDRRSEELSRDIRLLKSDRAYIEKMIREQMNFVRDDEILYVFPEKAHKESPGAAADEKKN